MVSEERIPKGDNGQDLNPDLNRSKYENSDFRSGSHKINYQIESIRIAKSCHERRNRSITWVTASRDT